MGPPGRFRQQANTTHEQYQNLSMRYFPKNAEEKIYISTKKDKYNTENLQLVLI